MMAPGCVVKVRRQGDIAWVAERRLPGGEWRLVSKAVDHRGHAVFSGRTAGEGEVTLIAHAPTYAVGAEIEHNGLPHVVSRDLGDAVELVVPPHSYKTHGGSSSPHGRATRRGGVNPRPPHGKRRGSNLLIAGGNLVTISKSDLTLEMLT
jgi:hypothetical protein